MERRHLPPVTNCKSTSLAMSTPAPPSSAAHLTATNSSTCAKTARQTPARQESNGSTTGSAERPPEPGASSNSTRRALGPRKPIDLFYPVALETNQVITTEHRSRRSPGCWMSLLVHQFHNLPQRPPQRHPSRACATAEHAVPSA